MLKAIQRNEFNQTESALVILSFEKNLKAKKELHRRKAEELARVEEEMADLNGQLARILEEVMRTEDQINTSRSIRASLIANLERVELNLARKNQELAAATGDSDSVGKRLADKQLELRKVEDLLLDAQAKEERESRGRSGKEESDAQRLATAEKKLKEAVAKNAEREVRRLLEATRAREAQRRLEGKPETADNPI